ncbi:MAG TPA: response regulator transcription factor [Sporichthyaceae bacterium]|nr:response regulator transcription factor [Sporichthyaceae bacterium]
MTAAGVLPSARPRVQRVLVADDHPIVAQGIERVVAAAPDLEVVATCYSGRDTVEVATRTSPDLLLLDVRLGDLDGSEVCRRLAVRAPGVRIVVLTAFDDIANLRRCLEAGARGVLLKGTLGLDLVAALRDVRDGRVVVDAGLAGRLETAQSLLDGATPAAPLLRPREVEVLRLIARGHTTKDIAAELDLTVNTVRSYTQALMEKLGAHTRVQAIVLAQQQQLI